MRKRIWFIILLFLFVLFTVFFLIYFNKVKFFKPISISISELNDADFGKINVFAETPFGKRVNLQKNIPERSFSTNGLYIFINNIFISLPKEAKTNNLKIILTHGTEKLIILPESFADYFEKTDSKLDRPTNDFQLKYFFPANIFQKARTVIYWHKDIINEIFSFLLCFIVSLVIIILLFNHFSFVREKVKHWIILRNNYKKFYFWLRVLFLAGNILLLIYFISLIEKKVFSFSTCFIFYLLILSTLIILTSLMGKLLKKSELFLNLRITIVVVMVMLIFIELILRSLQVNATYFEKTFGITNSGIYNNNTNFRRILKFTPNTEQRYISKEFKYYRKIYNNGFTQSFPSNPKIHNEVRILALGDSYTVGIGSPYDSTWVELLKKKLNKIRDGKYFDIFNAGVSGSDPVLEYALLTEDLQSYNPDFVIAMINESDINDFIIRGGLERLAKKDTIIMKEGPWWEWAFNISFVTRLIAINGLKYNQLLVKESDMKNETAIAIEKIEKTLYKFNAYTASKRMQFLTVFLPSPYELTNGGRYKFKTLIDNLNRNDIHAIDMFEKFSEEMNNNPNILNKYYWKIDGHCTPEGYNFVAETIYNYINGNELQFNSPQSAIFKKQL